MIKSEYYLVFPWQIYPEDDLKLLIKYEMKKLTSEADKNLDYKKMRQDVKNDNK